MMSLNLNNLNIDNELHIIIANNLKFLRRRARYTQSQVAQFLKISPSSYAHYERARREINVCSLKMLAIVYGVTMDQITAVDLSGILSDTIVSFPNYSYNKDDGSIIFKEKVANVKNKHSILWQVTINPLEIRVFESNMSHVASLDSLFRFKDKEYIGKIVFDTAGGGCFITGNTVTPFTKAEAKKDLIIHGMHMATILKEYESENFFS